MELRREWIDLQSVLAGAVEASRPLVERRNHQLNLTAPSGPLWLDADPVRLQVPFAGSTADEADGPACVGHGVVLNGVGAALLTSEAIFQHEGSNAARAEPLANPISFISDPEFPESSAGSYNNRSARRYLFGWQKKGDGCD